VDDMRAAADARHGRDVAEQYSDKAWDHFGDTDPWPRGATPTGASGGSPLLRGPGSS